MNSTKDSKELKIILKTVFGLEQVLAEELKELGFKETKILNRAVEITGNWKDVYFLNLHVRCAIAVLVEIESFRFSSEEDLYKKCMKTDWTQYFSVDKTFAVKGAVFSSLFKHTQYPHLLLKDAIVDTFRDKTGERPNVNIKTPQVLFDLYIQQNDAVISLNTSGVPLYQRGYRQVAGEAPLNEVVAAGLIRLSGWDGKTDFMDVFCGSGTLLIEAGMYAAKIPSNIERTHYAFKNFANFDSALWEKIYDEANKKCSSLPCKISGSDISPDMVTKAKRNLSGVAVGRFIDVQTKSFDELEKTDDNPLTIISNPPYGERMGDEVIEMYGDLGTWMKHKMPNSECWIISSNEDALKNVGLRPDRKIRLYNGDLECSFRKYKIFEGSKKSQFEKRAGYSDSYSSSEEE